MDPFCDCLCRVLLLIHNRKVQNVVQRQDTVQRSKLLCKVIVTGDPELAAGGQVDRHTMDR